MQRILSIALFSIWSAVCWSGQMANDLMGSPMTDAFNRLRISNPETPVVTATVNFTEEY